MPPNPHPPWVLHLDMDCFYVSVERLHRPELAGRPVIVGADPGGRGVVCSASYEARRFGVRSAMPISRAARLCPQAVFLPPRFERYEEQSARVRERLERFAPAVAQRSIDEFEADLTGCELLYRNDLFGACRALAAEIRRDLGLPCSIGLAANGLVAKVAAGRDKPEGAVWVPRGAEREFLAPLAVSRLPGVGEKLEEWLGRLGVRTVGDLARLGERWLEMTLGEVGRQLFARAIGRGSAFEASFWVDGGGAQKSISRETTFACDTEEPETIRRALSRLSESACRQLRALSMKADTVTLKIRHADFVTWTRGMAVPPTDLDLEIFAALMRLWRPERMRRVRLRLVGLKLSGLSAAPGRQALLFDDDAPRQRALLQAVDRISSRWRPGLVQFARSLGPAPEI